MANLVHHGYNLGTAEHNTPHDLYSLKLFLSTLIIKAINFYQRWKFTHIQTSSPLPAKTACIHTRSET